MQTINILLSRTFYRNELAFILPVLANKQRLAATGFRVRVFNEALPRLFEADTLIFSSKVAKDKSWWLPENKPQMFEFFEAAKKAVNHLIWADMGDSTGATHFEVLPHVDRYLKGAVLRDRKQYLQFQYGSRVFTDYYHREFKVDDADAGEPHLNFIPEEKQLEKIQLSWNQAYLNYSFLGSIFDQVRKYFSFLPAVRFDRFLPASKARRQLLSCRLSVNYGRNTIAYQRREVLKKLAGRIPTGKISRREFYRELSNSRVVVSPFGWGEVCYRDFEAILTGAALLKPDCEHMLTWPDLYIKNETYIPFKWDLSDFDETVDSLNDSKSLGEIANAAQARYKFYLNSEEGKDTFCERFTDLLRFTNGELQS